MKRWTSTLIPLIFPIIFNAQCPIGNIDFSSQAQIDSFKTAYPLCKEVEGRISVSCTDCTNLNGLSNLISIRQLFLVGLVKMESLEGLDNVKQIEELTIQYNQKLRTFRGLQNLVSVKRVAIQENSMLNELTGLDSLRTLQDLTIQSGHDFLIREVGNVDSLDQLYLEGPISIDSTGRTLFVNEMTLFAPRRLRSTLDISRTKIIPSTIRVEAASSFKLNRLDKIEETRKISLYWVNGVVLSDAGKRDVGISLEFDRCFDLSEFSPLEEINTTELKIRDCNEVKSLSGVNKQGSIKRIELIGNDNLVSIDELKNTDTLEYVTILDNWSLSECAIRPICDMLNKNYGEINIGNNFQGCRDRIEVVDQCRTVSVREPQKVEFILNRDGGIIKIVSQTGINRIQLIDYTGRSVIQRDNAREIEIEGISRGIYILCIEHSGQRTTWKVAL